VSCFQYLRLTLAQPRSEQTRIHNIPAATHSSIPAPQSEFRDGYQPYHPFCPNAILRRQHCPDAVIVVFGNNTSTWVGVGCSTWQAGEPSYRRGTWRLRGQIWSEGPYGGRHHATPFGAPQMPAPRLHAMYKASISEQRDWAITNQYSYVEPRSYSRLCFALNLYLSSVSFRSPYTGIVPYRL
jgi:hypothetical protein